MNWKYVHQRGSRFETNLKKKTTHEKIANHFVLKIVTLPFNSGTSLQ